MIIYDHRPPRIERWKRAAIVLLVVMLHLLLFWWLALIRAAPMPPRLLFPPMDVRLFDFGGGGSPAQEVAASSAPSSTPSAPSALHVPSETAPWDETIAAPPEPAPPEPLIGFGATPDLAAPAPSPEAGADAGAGAARSAATGGAGGYGGGSGGGVGTGLGAGSGPGRGGRGTGAILVRGPAGATITQNVSAGSLSALPGPYGVLRCQIRLNQQLDNCRVLNEHPRGAGVGQRALDRAQEFRFRPPRVGSRFRDRHRITVAIAFPPGPGAAEQP